MFSSVDSQSLVPFFILVAVTAAVPLETSAQVTPTFANATSATSTVWPAPTGPWLGPKYRWHFRNPLPIPPIKSPKFTYTKASTGASVDYYEVEVTATSKQVFPDRAATKMYAYDGLVPGPTFQMHKGREAVIRFTNNSPTNSSVHVHGQYNRAPFDGWASDYAHPGQYKDYYYPNIQNARTIWYHDHTEFETGKNVYMGLSGFYLLHDDEEHALKLPTGDYDIPMSISAKQYGQDGQLVYNENGFSGEWGDILEVNGQPWPYLKVEPRKYRLRLLNGAVSRTFNITINKDTVRNSAVPFNIIASDSGLFSHPVPSTNLAFAMGERYEIIIDFSAHKSKNITMYNSRGQPGMYDYAATDRIMRFVVSDTTTDSTNNGALPSTLRYIPPSPHVATTKNFNFSRENNFWVINGQGWADIENRILTRPTLGQDEIWELQHGGENASHPVHIHLVDFQILDRKGGRGAVLPWEKAGMKDVVWMAPGETIRVVARYAPWKGVYMFHCHNLVHEDHDMLVAFNVTQLAEWGYDNTTKFIDPMEPQFRPKNISAADYTDEAIKKKLDWFLSLDAYKITPAG